MTSKTYHSFTGLFPIHESFGDGVGCQDLIPGSMRADTKSAARPLTKIHPKCGSVPLSELLEHNTVGEALPADPNSF